MLRSAASAALVAEAMGVGIDELRRATLGPEPQPPAAVLELTRRQHWCVPEARTLAGRALSAGNLLVDFEATLNGLARTDYGYADARARRDNMRRIFEDAIATAVSLEAEVRRPSVSAWHAKRRKAILEAHPEVAALYGDSWASPLACAGLAAAQFCVAVYLLAPPSPEAPFDGRYALRALFWALLVGANCAFGSQALCHELSHSRNTLVAAPCALLASSLTTFPWFAYYFAGGHERHHAHVGTPRDADADALFWLWERAPIHASDVYAAGGSAAAPPPSPLRSKFPKSAFLADTPAGGVVWASTVAAALPAAYAYSLLSCLRDDWAANVRETRFWIGESAVSAIAMAGVCRTCESRPHALAALLYFALSAAASVGFLLHPCIGFWLMQHACAEGEGSGGGRMANAYAPPSAKATAAGAPLEGGHQPTLSYAGSPLWHWLTFQELRHLEHHDFPGIPWTRLPRLAEIAPEFYGTAMHHVPSIPGLLSAWLFADGDKFDFACRKRLVKRARDRAATRAPRYDSTAAEMTDSDSA